MSLVLSERAAAGLGPARPKYRARPVYWCPVCGLALVPCARPEHPVTRFASKAEAWHWWHVLRPLEQAGTIWALRRQVTRRLLLSAPDGTVVDLGRYTSDFEYVDAQHTYHVVDVKGKLTRDGKLRLALMRVCHGITVELVASSPPDRWLED